MASRSNVTLVLTLALWVGACAPRPRNVVVYLVDTLRADHLGVYGYKRPTSPRLDEFARTAVVFDQAYANSSWTRPSVLSLFTGLHPGTHDVQASEDVAADALLTMAEVFHAAGYETAAFSTNVHVSSAFNLHQGFEHFTFFDPEVQYAGRGEPPRYVQVDAIFPAVAEWITRARERPFFLYVHTMDVHPPHTPPATYRLWGKLPGDAYDAAILFTDHYFGRLVDLLAARGLLDDTLVIFTADHGEEMGDHGQWGHGHTLYNELLRVPLLVRHPAVAPGRRAETVREIDVLPTLADWLALGVAPGAVQGISFLPLLTGGRDTVPAPRPVLAQAGFPARMVGASLQMDGHKVIHVVSDRRGRKDDWELFDLRADPGERANQAEAAPARLADYRQRLVGLEEETTRAAVPGEHRVLDPTTRERMRALGYVQ